MDQTFGPLLQEDAARLAAQVSRVRAISSEHCARDLGGDDGDLDVLQEILDGGFIERDATYDLQCLGIVFGMRVAHGIEGLAWVMVQDEFGRDPALRYLDTSLVLYPLTMISKRVEDGAEVDVHDMFEWTRARVAELNDQVTRPH